MTVDCYKGNSSQIGLSCILKLSSCSVLSSVNRLSLKACLRLPCLKDTCVVNHDCITLNMTPIMVVNYNGYLTIKAVVLICTFGVLLCVYLIYLKKPVKICNATDDRYTYVRGVGGGKPEIFTAAELQDHVIHNKCELDNSSQMVYKFDSYCPLSQYKANREDVIVCDMPLDALIDRLIVVNLKLVAAVHGIYIKSKSTQPDIINILQNHICTTCPECVAIFCPVISAKARRKAANHVAVKEYRKRIKATIIKSKSNEKIQTVERVSEIN